MFRKPVNEVRLPKEMEFHCLRRSFAIDVLQKGTGTYSVNRIVDHFTSVMAAEFYEHSTALNYREVTDLL